MGTKGQPHLGARLAAAIVVLAALSAICCLLYILLPTQVFDSLFKFIRQTSLSNISSTIARNPVLWLVLALALYMTRRIYQAYEKAWFSRVFNSISNFVQGLASSPQTPEYCEDVHSLRLKLFPEIEMHGAPIKLYGRDAEFKWLKRQISILQSSSSRASRAVLLWGEQGIGKTQLAYCFATELMERRRLFSRWYAWYVEGVFDAGRILESLPNAPVILIWDDVSLSDANNSRNLKILLSNRGRKKPLFVITTGWQGRSDDLLFAFDRVVNAELQIVPLADSEAVKIYANAMLISDDQRGHPLLLRLLADQGTGADADLGKDPLWSVCRRWAKSFEKRLDSTYGLSLEARRALAVVSCSGRCPWDKAVKSFDLKEADKDALLRTGRLRERSGDLWLDPLRPDLLGWAFCLEILNNTPHNLLKNWRLLAAELGLLTVPRFIAFAIQKKQMKTPWVKMLRDLLNDAEVNIYSSIVESLENVERYAIEKRFEDMEREILGIYDSAPRCTTLKDAPILAADAAAHAVEAYLNVGNEFLAKPHLEFIYDLAASPHVNIDIARIITRIQAAKISFASIKSQAERDTSEYRNPRSYPGDVPADDNHIYPGEQPWRTRLSTFAEHCRRRAARISDFYFTRRQTDKPETGSSSILAANSISSYLSHSNLVRSLYFSGLVTISLVFALVFFSATSNRFLLAGLSFLLFVSSLVCVKYVRTISVVLSSLWQSLRDAEDLRIADLRESLQQREDLERKASQAVHDANVALLAKGEFLAAISHEIRVPLNGIVPMLDLLMHNRLPADQAEMVHTAFLSSQQMLRIVDDILDYSKLEASKLQLESTTFNLRETLESVIQLMERPAQSKGLRLSLQINPSVRLPVRGDPVRLRQVLSNLISNAVKFTERGSISLNVRKVGDTSAQHQLRFEVRDTGIGISMAAQERLFQAFSQADASTTRLYGGTGLGLAISKRIIDLMGGRIGVESDAGQGAMFWFEVPMLKVQGDIIAHKTVENTGGRILLLTDDQRLRLRLSMLLPNWGLRITTVETTQQALERLRSAANEGGEWVYTAVIADLASVRSTAVALQRNLERENTYGQVRLICLLGDEQAPEKLLMSATLLQRHSPDADLRAALLAMIDTAPQPAVGEFALETPLAKSPVQTLDVVAATPAAAKLDTAQPAPAEREPARPMRVLLVEDNPVNLMVGQRLLSVLGTHCDSATNGEAALLRMSASRYDLVLMDCQMPVMDGYTATRRWREHEAASGSRRLPIVAMTANAMAGDRQKCLDAGMDDYLAKPITRGEVERCLDHWHLISSQQPAARIAPAPIKPPPPVLDLSVLDELRDLLGNEVYDLIRVFLDDTPRLIAALERAAPGPDYDTLRNAAHTLKSSSANLGAMSLSNAAKRVERCARVQTLERPEVEVALIVGEFAHAKRALELFMAAS